MTGARYYPKASRVQDFSPDYPGSHTNPNIVVLHTTETSTWPDYDGGSKAPNFTVFPDIAGRRLRFRQHFAVDESSRALRNEAGGVETNTLNAVQIELVGSCDPNGGISLGRFNWTDPPDWALRDLAEFLVWLHAEWPAIPLKDAAPRGWLPYPSSYGNSRGQRMTFAEWRNAYGICGHQHVPENVHGDPGAFPIARLLAYANHPSTPTPTPAPEVPVEPKQYTAIPVTIGTFNNKGYPPMALHEVNEGDYTFRNFLLDLGGEQERWVPGQYGGFKKIFAKPVYEVFPSLALKSGTAVLHRTTKFHALAQFRFTASKAVLGVCGARKITGKVLEFKEAPGATLTHFSMHPPPKAWSNALAKWPSRQRAAQREWKRAVDTAKAFAARQIAAGRDFVVIETDSNSSADRLKEALGKEIAGKPVHVFTTTYGYRIDHIVVIGEIGKVVWEKDVSAPSDHNPFAVRLWLRVPIER